MSLEIIDVSRTIAATLKRNIKVPIQDLQLRLACVLKRREGIIAYLTSPFFFFVGSMAVWGCFLFSSLPVFYWLLIFTKQKDAVCVPFVISFCLFSFPVYLLCTSEYFCPFCAQSLHSLLNCGDVVSIYVLSVCHYHLLPFAFIVSLTVSAVLLRSYESHLPFYFT